MIASTIGKTFLKAYNQRFQTQHSAKEFFVEVLAPLFFDFPKYMRMGGNAPLENPKFKGGRRPAAADRKVRIANTIQKIDEEPEKSSAIGFPSHKITATTSGQVSNLGMAIQSEDAYYSWIGSGFAIGVEGGLSFFFNKIDILMAIYEGWQYYRNYLEEIKSVG